MMSTESRDKSNCPTIYGPVASRRHGRSLGINLGGPEQKICTWGCVYCQCGMGERRAAGSAAEDQVPAKARVIELFRTTLLSCGELDSVTFAGNSEPTAHPEFFEIVREIRRIRYMMRARWILNCLSNGSELDRDAVVAACDLLDEAWIKLDCAHEDLHRRLNRPMESLAGVEAQIARIKRLKKPRIQTLLWKCPTDPRLENLTQPNLDALVDAYVKIQPVEVHVTTLARDPALPQLEPAPLQELEAFSERVRAAGVPARAFG